MKKIELSEKERKAWQQMADNPDKEVIHLSAKDYARLICALEKPAKPIPKLVKAFKKYQKMIDDGELVVK
jgi:uncharacterized protein (DUF1778 family)